MVDDVSIDREFFDPDFFVYREDADVAWRAQLMAGAACTTPMPGLSRPHRASWQPARLAAEIKHALR